MDYSTKEYLNKLLYNENTDKVISEIEGISDSKLLHMTACNNNWDDGFEVPYSIIKNVYCDLGTALMIFYDADGYAALSDSEYFNTSDDDQWVKFIGYLKNAILNDEFKYRNIKFVPPLTKVQIYKLKKNNTENIFIEELNGEEVEVPDI